MCLIQTLTLEYRITQSFFISVVSIEISPFCLFSTDISHFNSDSLLDSAPILKLITNLNSVSTDLIQMVIL